MRLLLFDLDGTLLHSDGAGRRALDAAFAERCGWEDATAGVSFAGSTDPGIVADVFARFGRDPGEAAEEAPHLFACYVRHLEAQLATRAGSVRALPGAPELLPALAARGDVVLGVLTGNVEGGARLKLAAAGLSWSFAVGAFGDEAPTRPDLLPVALTRTRALTGRSLAPADVVVIGDTPRDVEVARVHGARAVGVACGFAPREDLVAAEPDVLLEDLADPGVLDALGLSAR